MDFFRRKNWYYVIFGIKVYFKTLKIFLYALWSNLQ